MRAACWRRACDRVSSTLVLDFVCALSMACGLFGVCATGADAAGWAVQAVPGPSIPSGQLVAVSCSSGAHCSAVGSSVNSAGIRVTLAERWDGGGWAVERTLIPAGYLNSELTGVSCVSRRVCFAVGESTERGGKVGLIERWNGRRWSIQPGPDIKGGLSAVSCVSASDCGAVGALGAERWNGRSWAVTAAHLHVDALSCVSRNACMAVGVIGAAYTATWAERWNGQKWSVQRIPTIDGNIDVLSGVACVSAAACIAVGSDNTGGEGGGQALAERWNGRKWAFMSLPQPFESELTAVSCKSARSCVAVGDFVSDPVSGKLVLNQA